MLGSMKRVISVSRELGSPGSMMLELGSYDDVKGGFTLNKDPYGQLASSLYASMSKQTRQAMGGVGVLGTITSTGLKLDDFKHESGLYGSGAPGMLSCPVTAKGTVTLGASEDMTFDAEENEVEDTLLNWEKV